MKNSDDFFMEDFIHISTVQLRYYFSCCQSQQPIFRYSYYSFYRAKFLSLLGYVDVNGQPWIVIPIRKQRFIRASYGAVSKMIMLLLMVIRLKVGGVTWRKWPNITQFARGCDEINDCAYGKNTNRYNKFFQFEIVCSNLSACLISELAKCLLIDMSQYHY